MNLYATLDDLKADMKITEAQEHADLMRKLEAASRAIEQPELAGRWFYSWEGTRYYDGARDHLWLPDDILSITTLKVDTDGDGVYETSYAASDYRLYPLNSYPKVLLQINRNGSYGSFAPGVDAGIEIAGVFGWAVSSTPYREKTTLNGALDATQTDVVVTDGSQVKIGQTIRVDSEQMWVEEISQNKLVVERGVNGTTAATHTDTTKVYVYVYPADISHAVSILTMRAWKRKDSAYQDVVGMPETGQVITSKGIDPDVAKLVAPYRRRNYV